MLLDCFFWINVLNLDIKKNDKMFIFLVCCIFLCLNVFRVFYRIGFKELEGGVRFD